METIETPHLSALETLLESSSPGQLRNSLEDLFFTCFSEERVVLPSHEMVRDVYFLILFLRELGER